MRVAIIGAGRIGAGIARQLARSDHELAIAFSRDPESLQRLAAEIGPRVAASTPREAIALAEVVVLSVPWDAIDLALGQAGPLHGKIVIDTTNHFGASPGPTPGQTAAQFNARRMPGARYTKSFNTMTAAFQAGSAGRTGAERVVQWLCGDDEDAKRTVGGLIVDAGFVAVDIGGTARAAPIESPRRAGALYGEEYHLDDARAALAAIRAGEPLPPTPSYPTQ